MQNAIETPEEKLPPGELRTAVCPVCERFVLGDPFPIAALPESLQSIITPNAGTTNATEVCARCVELFSRAQRQIQSHASVFEQNDFVLPTPLRMDADERFTGRGVTIAFLDSGFYRHPDLTKPRNRIRAYQRILAGGDFEESYLTTSLSQTVDECTRAGITVVCAVGNAGHLAGHPVLPPASAPSCIAVGGLDDQNSLDRARRGMYRSSYGPTVDGLQKPEVIAPGIWVPAPILPHTPTAEEARLYAELDAGDDDQLRAIIEAHTDLDKELFEARNLPVPLLRQLITIKLREGN